MTVSSAYLNSTIAVWCSTDNFVCVSESGYITSISFSYLHCDWEKAKGKIADYATLFLMLLTFRYMHLATQMCFTLIAIRLFWLYDLTDAEPYGGWIRTSKIQLFILLYRDLYSYKEIFARCNEIFSRYNEIISRYNEVFYRY